MRNLLAQLHADDSGVITLEYLILATFLALGLIVGVHTLASALNGELVELGNAITAMSQSYATDGFAACNANKEGSRAIDTPSVEDGTNGPLIPSVIDASFCD